MPLHREPRPAPRVSVAATSEARQFAGREAASSVGPGYILDREMLERLAVLTRYGPANDDPGKRMEVGEEGRLQAVELARIGDQNAFDRRCDGRLLDRRLMKVRAARAPIRMYAARRDEGLVDAELAQIGQAFLR